MNKLREAVTHGKKLCGCLVSLTDPALCEMMGNAGFDLVWIDMEHTYMSYKEVLAHLNAARSVGIASLVRLPQNDMTATKKLLEMDPDGILFPMVRTAEEARVLIESTLYPPLGTRGFGPMRAIRYGADDMIDYITHRSLETCRFIQIEDVRLIDQLDEVVQIPYLDGCVFGPNDLAGSLGELGNPTGDNTVAQIRRAIDILHKHGKYIGLAVGHDEATVRFWSQFGVDLFVAGADWNFVYGAGKQTCELLHTYHAQ